MVHVTAFFFIQVFKAIQKSCMDLLRAIEKYQDRICSKYSLNIFFSHLSASTLSSVSAGIVTCQCFLSSAISVVIWFLAIFSFTRSCHLNFGLLDVSFDQFWSVISFSWPRLYLAFAHVQTISTSSLGGILPSSTCGPDVYTYHITQHAHFSCVWFPLVFLLSNCPTFCSVYHGQFYSHLVHFVFHYLLLAFNGLSPGQKITRLCAGIWIQIVKDG